MKYFLDNYRFRRKSGNNAYSRGLGGVMLFESLWHIVYKNWYATQPKYVINVDIQRESNSWFQRAQYNKGITVVIPCVDY